jgi:hypothetical protein
MHVKRVGSALSGLCHIDDVVSAVSERDAGRNSHYCGLFVED